LADLSRHFQQRELADRNPRISYSTKKAYAGYLEKWIDPRWGEYKLLDVRAVEVESWLKSLNRAPGTRSKIRNVMSLLFNHGRRHELCDHNPIQWVRQSAKRRTADGKLTGVVYEYAKFQINHRRSDMATEEEVLQQTREFFQDAVKLGITSVQDMSGPGGAERCVMASRKAPTPIRMRVIRMASTTVNGRDKTEGRALPLHAAPLITVSGTKWLLDGSPIERTAALRKPYTDLPSTSGELDFPEKEMEAILRESLQNDDQLMVHATSDRATEMFLNAMDATGGPKVWASKRVRIEHGDGIMPELIARVKGMGLIVVENPTHLALRELFVRRFGVERADQMQPMRSLLDAGIPLAIGSDGPNNPYLNIMLASNYPGKPKEAITREQAVIAYTLTSAYAEFAEKDKGSLEPGKFADLAVLSQDIFSVPPPELPKTESVLTMVGGKIVFDAKALSTP